MATLTYGYQADGTPYSYTTLASAIAAASTGDTIECYYTTANQGLFHLISTTVTKRVNIVGMIPNAKPTFTLLTFNVTLDGPMLLQDIIVQRNFSGTTQPGSTDTLTINRCATYTTFQFSAATNGGTIMLKSCRANTVDADGYRGESGNRLQCYNCDSIATQYNGFVFCDTYNCKAFGCPTFDINTYSGDYNAYQNASGSGTNDVQTTFENAGFHPYTKAGDYRITTDSVLYQAGYAYANAPSTDFWGNAFTSPPSIGADAGVFYATDADSVLTTAGGNWTIANSTLYAEGNTYGVGGTSEVGTLVCEAPTSPTLSVVNNDDGTATATISGADAGTTNTVYMYQDEMVVTPEAVATISENGSKKFTVSPIGLYWFYALSNLSDNINISENVVRVDISDGSDTVISEEDSYIVQYGEEFTVQTYAQGVDENYARTATWQDSHTANGWKQPIGSDLQLIYERRSLNVTHKVWFAVDPVASEGDRIVDANGVEFVIRGVTEQAGTNRLWRVDVQEQN